MTAWKPHFFPSTRGKRKFMVVLLSNLFFMAVPKGITFFYPLLNEKKSVFLLVKCLFNVWHASLVQWGVLCKSSEYSDNNKPHLTFCLLDTGCSHTVYRSEELLSQQFLGTDISLFTSFTVSFDWWKSSGHFLVPCVDIGGHTQQMKQISVLFLQRSYNYLNTSVSLKWSGLLCCSVWETVLCQVPPLLLLLKRSKTDAAVIQPRSTGLKQMFDHLFLSVNIYTERVRVVQRDWWKIHPLIRRLCNGHTWDLALHPNNGWLKWLSVLKTPLSFTPRP